MSFEEDLLSVVEEARAKRDKEELAIRNFEGDWAKKSREVFHVLQLAAKVFNDNKWIDGGEAELKIGHSAVLHATRNERGNFRYHLEFTRASPPKIICRSSIRGETDKSFDLEDLTPEAVGRKIKDFASAVALKPPSGSTIGGT